MDGRTEVVIHELACSANSTLSDGLVMNVLDAMQTAESKGAGEFEELAQSQLRARVRQHGTHMWGFFIPVAVAFHQSVRVPPRIRVLNRIFRFASDKSLERRVRRKVLQEALTGLHDGKSPDSSRWYFAVVDKGHSWEDAWRNLEPAFDALRGLTEFVCGQGRATLRFPPEPRARAMVPHPRFMLVRSPKGELEFVRFLGEDQPVEHVFTMGAEILSALGRLTRRIAREPSADSSLAVVLDALRLYAQAMDARFSYASFLGPWQVLEAISLSPGGRTEDVIKKIAWHGQVLRLPGSGFARVLEEYARKRNDIVHRGIHKIDQEDVNLIKGICEVALKWLIRESRVLRTKTHLEVFYRLRTGGDAVVAAHSEVSRYVAREVRRP